MLTIESANNGRNGVFGFVGALIFGAAAPCFIIFMGGTAGIAFGAVCGGIGLACAAIAFAVNWLQSKKERDAALAYHQSGTVNNVVNTIDKVVNVSKSVGKEEAKPKAKEDDEKSVSTAASSTDVSSNTKRIISKIIKSDGTISTIEGSLNNVADKNLKLIEQIIETREV